MGSHHIWIYPLASEFGIVLPEGCTISSRWWDRRVQGAEGHVRKHRADLLTQLCVIRQVNMLSSGPPFILQAAKSDSVIHQGFNWLPQNKQCKHNCLDSCEGCTEVKHKLAQCFLYDYSAMFWHTNKRTEYVKRETTDVLMFTLFIIKMLSSDCWSEKQVEKSLRMKLPWDFSNVFSSGKATQQLQRTSQPKQLSTFWDEILNIFVLINHTYILIF